MLDRPRKPHDRAEARRLRQRRHRQRLASGRMTVSIEIGCAEVDMLARLHWLSECEAYDRHQIARAIEHLLADAARR
jgi:hypothetical protein